MGTVGGDPDPILGAGLEHRDRAVNHAIAQLLFAKVSESKDALQAGSVMGNAADKRIKLPLDKLVNDATKLKVRVGPVGDDSRRVTILDRIKANLRAPARD